MKKFVVTALISLILLGGIFKLKAQERSLKKLDSLKGVLQKSQTDTHRVNTLLSISQICTNNNKYDEALDYAAKGLELAKKLNFKKGEIKLYNNIGVTYWYTSQFDSALKYNSKSKEIATLIKDEGAVADSRINLANILQLQGDYTGALENYQTALSYFDKVGNKKRIAATAKNIGYLYMNLQKFDKALQYNNQALEIYEATNDLNGIGESRLNIGSVWANFNKFDSALTEFQAALDIFRKINYKVAEGIALENIGLICMFKLDYKSALKYANESLALRQSLDDKAGAAAAMISIAGIYWNMKGFASSLQWYQKALNLTEEMGLINQTRDIYRGMARVYESMHDYKLAYEAHKKYFQTNDSILNSESLAQIIGMEAKYLSEKKDKELLKKDSELKLHKADAEQQRIIRNSFIAGFGLVLILILVVLRSFRQKQKANKILEEKNELIKMQKAEVEEKQKEILDSIHYARRIQRAHLPSEKYLVKSLDRLQQ